MQQWRLPPALHLSLKDLNNDKTAMQSTRTTGFPVAKSQEFCRTVTPPAPTQKTPRFCLWSDCARKSSGNTESLPCPCLSPLLQEQTRSNPQPQESLWVLLPATKPLWLEGEVVKVFFLSQTETQRERSPETHPAFAATMTQAPASLKMEVGQHLNSCPVT